MKHAINFIAACALITGATSVFASEKQPAGHAHSHGIDAVGKPGVLAKVTRTIAIDMSDAMRFTPSEVSVRQGETIRFVVKNLGQLKHEFNLGTDKDLKAHYELMKKFPEMEHDEPNIASVAPGGTGEVIWQFTKAGKVSFACLHVGHYDAGMKGSVTVAGDDMTRGEVRKVDKEAGKITIKHEEIKNLEMPPMTMVFSVKDKTRLEKVQAGDKIRFVAISENGKLLATDIQTTEP